MESQMKYCPSFVPPCGESVFDYFLRLASEGFVKKYSERTEEIIKRFEYEIDTIRELGVVEYFLIWRDIIDFANQNGIATGTGRGSCVGSVVCYALGITKVDPIKHGLIFERFINKERFSLPDIDVDFDFARRDEIAGYIKEKYGAECVAVSDSRDCEKAGLLCLDVLGIRVLGAVQMTALKVQKSKPDFDINLINYSDKNVYNCLCGGLLKEFNQEMSLAYYENYENGKFDKKKLLGAIQSEGEKMQKLLRDLRPDCIDDIIAAISLNRPGTMDFAEQYITGKHYPSACDFADGRVKTILHETHGVILYQEQVIRILTDIGGFSAEKADILRREISKRKRETIAKAKVEFILGASNKAITIEVAAKIFDRLTVAAPYSFLKAHATACAYLAYQTAFLNCYYPTEYGVP